MFQSDEIASEPPKNQYELVAIRQMGYEMLMSAKRFEDQGLVNRPPRHSD